MLRDELIEVVENCIKVIKEAKGYVFELDLVDNGKPTSDYDKDKLEDNKTVFHIILNYYDTENPLNQINKSIELLQIIPNDFTDEEKLEHSKRILTELNSAAKDFKAGREYEPTYIKKLKTIFELSNIFGSSGWYM